MESYLDKIHPITGTVYYLYVLLIKEYKRFKFGGSCRISSPNNLRRKGAVHSVDKNLKYIVIFKTGA